MIVYPGSLKGRGLEAGIRRIVAALDEVISRTRGYRVRVLLENTAAGGATIGRSFAFRWLMRDRRFARAPMVLETPKDPGPTADRAALALLRRLRTSASG